MPEMPLVFFSFVYFSELDYGGGNQFNSSKSRP